MNFQTIPRRPRPGQRAWVAIVAAPLALAKIAAAQAAPEPATFCCDRPRLLPAAAEILGAQLLPWSVNRFVRKADFAKISPASIWSNMQTGFEWDPNSFSTNQFAHPFHGNLYFNAGRTNGYSYWQSAMWAFSGSLMWEMAGETFRGAINDWVATSVGGMSIGEATYRLSMLIRDNEARGADRAFREILGALVDPMAAVSRLTRGEHRKIGPNPPGRRPASLGTWIDVGERDVDQDSVGLDGLRTRFVQVAVQYGDPFQPTFEKPFDTFTLDLQANLGDKQTIGALRVDGALWRARLSDSSAATQSVFLLSQRYEYQNNLAFEFGAQSVAAQLQARFRLANGLRVRSRVGVHGVLLGAVNSEYAALAGREYDFVTGAGLHADASLTHARFTADARYEGTFFHTVNGSPLDHITHVLTARVAGTVWGNFGVGVFAGYFIRSSRYDQFPTVTRKNPELRVFATYTLSPLP